MQRCTHRATSSRLLQSEWRCVCFTPGLPRTLLPVLCRLAVTEVRLVLHAICFARKSFPHICQRYVHHVNRCARLQDNLEYEAAMRGLTRKHCRDMMRGHYVAIEAKARDAFAVLTPLAAGGRQLAPGERLPHFPKSFQRFTEYLGGGGTGTVLRAKFSGGSPDRAVKVRIPPIDARYPNVPPYILCMCLRRAVLSAAVLSAAVLSSAQHTGTACSCAASRLTTTTHAPSSSETRGRSRPGPS